MNKTIDINGSIGDFLGLMAYLEKNNPNGWEYKPGTPRLFFFPTDNPTYHEREPGKPGKPMPHLATWSVFYDPLFNDEESRRASIECFQIGKTTTLEFRDGYAAIYDQPYGAGRSSGQAPDSFKPIGLLFEKFVEWVESQLQKKGVTNAVSAADVATPAPSTKSKRGPRGNLSKKEKGAAYREWNEVDGDSYPGRLEDWLEEKFGFEADGTLNVPPSTFYGWKKYQNLQDS